MVRSWPRLPVKAMAGGPDCVHPQCGAGMRCSGPAVCTVYPGLLARNPGTAHLAVPGRRCTGYGDGSPQSLIRGRSDVNQQSLLNYSHSGSRCSRPAFTLFSLFSLFLFSACFIKIIDNVSPRLHYIEKSIINYVPRHLRARRRRGREKGLQPFPGA